ncbi:hypothetical protein [Novosphingobium sp. M1R2S20]|uniref:Uncharacterized protein n=1 Tax=Novosphingobium rhizovicinum TaxID=3228928 RepID=A0ABV3RD22_9SPHN
MGTIVGILLVAAAILFDENAPRPYRILIGLPGTILLIVGIFNV